MDRFSIIKSPNFAAMSVRFLLWIPAKIPRSKSQHDHLAVDFWRRPNRRSHARGDRDLLPLAAVIGNHPAGNCTAEIGRPQFLAARRFEGIEITAHVAEQ